MQSKTVGKQIHRSSLRIFEYKGQRPNCRAEGKRLIKSVDKKPGKQQALHTCFFTHPCALFLREKLHVNPRFRRLYHILPLELPSKTEGFSLFFLMSHTCSVPSVLFS